MIKTINSRSNTPKIELFIGILVTDNVSSDADLNTDITLKHAEETILKTASIRREFLATVLTEIGILKQDKVRSRGGRAIGY